MKFTHEDVHEREREDIRRRRRRRRKKRFEEEGRRMREKEYVGEDLLLVAFPRRAVVLLFEVRAA